MRIQVFKRDKNKTFVTVADRQSKKVFHKKKLIYFLINFKLHYPILVLDVLNSII